mgnify:CR=1 FL=1
MINNITKPFKWFFKLESASGLVLLFSAIIALLNDIVSVRLLLQCSACDRFERIRVNQYSIGLNAFHLAIILNRNDLVPLFLEGITTFQKHHLINENGCDFFGSMPRGRIEKGPALLFATRSSNLFVINLLCETGLVTYPKYLSLLARPIMSVLNNLDVAEYVDDGAGLVRSYGSITYFSTRTFGVPNDA